MARDVTEGAGLRSLTFYLRASLIPTTLSDACILNWTTTWRGKRSRKFNMGTDLNSLFRKTKHIINLLLRWYIVINSFVLFLPCLSKLSCSNKLVQIYRTLLLADDRRAMTALKSTSVSPESAAAQKFLHFNAENNMPQF